MAIRHLLRRFCRSILLSDTDSTSEEEHTEKRGGSTHTDEKHENVLHMPPSPPSHTILSSRSSFLVLPSTTTHHPVSPTDTLPLSHSNRRALQKLSKASIRTHDGRPSTAPSTPRSSSPRILRSIPRLGPSSPSSPLPRLSFSASQANARRGHASGMSTLEEREIPTPLLSCCSKEVAEDPFARVCPSPEFSRLSLSNAPSSSSSSSRRHGSSTTPCKDRSKSSTRPSTAPALSLESTTPVSSSASSSTLDFACVGKGSGLSSNVSSLSRSTNLSPDKDTSRKPTLSPLTTSSSFSSNSSKQQSTSASHNPSSGWPIASLPSPSSPDLSSFSSSFSSSHSGFSDATFNTLDTVTTSNLSSEGNGSAGRFKQQYGRTRANARALDVFDDMRPSLPVPSPAALTIEEPKLQHAVDHSGSTHYPIFEPATSSSTGQAKLLLDLPSKPSFFTVDADYGNTAVEKKEDPFSDEAGVPDSIVRRGLEAQERLKCLRPAHAASRFIEDLHHHAGNVEQPMKTDSKVVNGATTQSVDDAGFYHHFQPHLRFAAGRSFPVAKRSVTAPAAVSTFFSVMKNDRSANNDKQGNQSNSCTPTPSGPSTPRCEANLTISPFELLNTVIGQEDRKSLQQEEEANRNGNNPFSDTDYRINRNINFSSFDLSLDSHGIDNDNDRITTSIPLPQMSWFPEPTPQLSTSNSLYSKIEDTSNVSASGKKKMIGRPATSDGITTKKMNWNLIGRGKARVSKNTIGYPSTSS